MSFSTHVNVMPPSLLLSLKRSRKVPGGFGLRMALSLSLLMKPVMYLQEKPQEVIELEFRVYFENVENTFCNTERAIPGTRK